MKVSVFNEGSGAIAVLEGPSGGSFTFVVANHPLTIAEAAEIQAAIERALR